MYDEDHTVMHPTYLPFAEEHMRMHFAEIKRSGKCTETADKHVQYYKRSIQKHFEFCEKALRRKGKPISELKVPCQIEKDERVWTASYLMAIFHAKERAWILGTSFSGSWGRPSVSKKHI